MKIACVNYQPVTLYREQGWSNERLSQYYNPCDVADEVAVFAYDDVDWEISESVYVLGWNDSTRLFMMTRDFRPDIIRCYEANYPFCIIAASIARSLRIPSYLSLHDRRKIDPLRVNELRRYSVITAYNESLRKAVSGWMGREVELQLNGVDENLFKPDEALVGEARGKFHVFTVGRDDPVKNIPDMMRATDILDERLGGGKVIHIIAGPGLGSMGSEHIHFFTGNTSERDIVKYLNWCDCLFMVQTVPDLGFAQTEPLFVGKPVVVPFAEGGGTGVLDGRTARFVPMDKVHDPEYMADVLHDCLASKFDPVFIRNFAIENFSASVWRKKEADRYCRFSRKKTG